MVLVTGATGLIGSYLLEQLLSQGHKVRAICRQAQPERTNLTWIKGDILDLATLSEAVKEVTHVYHCAGLVSFAPRDNRLLYKINTEGTANVVNACLKVPGIKLIHVSSVAAIGKIAGEATLNENSRWEAQQGHCVYAASKHWAEAEVWRGVAEGLRAVIVNPSVVLGGTDLTRSSTRLLQYVWKENPFYIDGVANFVDVRDVVQAMVKAGFSDLSGERFILNAGSMAYPDFFEQVAHCLGKKPPHIKVNAGVARALAWAEHLRSVITGARPLITPDTVRRTKDAVAYDATKARQLLGITFTPLPETIAWACEQVKYRQAN